MRKKRTSNSTIQTVMFFHIASFSFANLNVISLKSIIHYKDRHNAKASSKLGPANVFLL